MFHSGYLFSPPSFGACLCESYHTAFKDALQGLLQNCVKLLELTGTQPFAQFVEVLHFGLLRCCEDQSVSAKGQVVLSSGSWWGSPWLTKNNVSSWPALFWFDRIVGSLV